MTFPVSAASVAKSLEAARSGDYAACKDLLAQINGYAAEKNDAALAVCLTALKENASLLGKHSCESLVLSVQKLHWPEFSPDLYNLYKAFTLQLLSAHTYCLKSTVSMIVRWFGVVRSPDWDNDPPEAVAGSDTNTSASTSSPSAVPAGFVISASACSCLHDLLSSIIELAPSAVEVLVKAVSDAFPYHTKPTLFQTTYVANLLHCARTLPGIRKSMLFLVFSKLLNMDLSAPRDDLPCVRHEETQDIFDLELSESEMRQSKQRAAVAQISEKLDSLLCLLFEFIRDFCHENGVYKHENAEILSVNLFTIFCRVFLFTPKSSHVQFIYLYFFSLHEEFTSDFVSMLWGYLTGDNPNPLFDGCYDWRYVPAVKLRTSAYYLGGILATANYIKISTVMSCLQSMVQWCHGSRTGCTSYRSDEEQLSNHNIFYAVCVNVFYIIIARHREILQQAHGFEFLLGLSLQSLAASQLNPLRYCPANISSRFCSIMRHNQLIYLDTILERNRLIEKLCTPAKRNLSFSESRSSTPASLESLQNDETESYSDWLSAVLPFDVYLLPRSAKYVTPLHRPCDVMGYMTHDPAAEDGVETEESAQSSNRHRQESTCSTLSDDDLLISGLSISPRPLDAMSWK